MDRVIRDDLMLWEAVCMCFGGFLRTEEVEVPSAAEYDPGIHISYGDVTVDNVVDPQFV